jgi:uncharacterized protein YndB with AHSA1/START domain
MYGSLDRLDDGRWQLRFERTLPHGPEKVWRALTEPEHLARWFPTTIEGEWTPRAPLRFSFPGRQAPPFDGEMLVYEPPSVIEFRWGPDIIRIEVRAVAQGSALTLLDTLEERGKAARDGAGWHTCLDTLASHLAGTNPDPSDSMTEWQRVHPHYVDQFGSEASAIGPPPGFE